MLGTVFAGQKTQPTVSKYTEGSYKGKQHKKQRKQYTQKYEIEHAKKIRIL